MLDFLNGKKYFPYGGEITPAQPNLLNRNFKAGHPNEKWLTDITEFRIPTGKVYPLSLSIVMMARLLVGQLERSQIQTR